MNNGRRTIPATQFKSHCLRILDEVAEGAEVVVTKRGRAVAVLRPPDPLAKRKPTLGLWKGKLKIAGDIVNFSLWEGLGDAFKPER